MVFVANFYRPLTQTPADALDVMREIEQACGIKFTAIINNSNIGWETSPHDVIKTVPLASELEQMSEIPVIMTTAENNVALDLSEMLENVFPMTLQKKYFDINHG